MTLRQTLRERSRHKRDQLDSATRSQAAERAAKLLVDSDIFQTSRTVACYCAIGSEIETRWIIEAIWAAKKHCYLPILSLQEKGFLHFGEYSEHSILQRNQYGIPEPDCDENICILPAQLDLVLIPLIAFDRQGNRLGTGAGYYDRTFAFKKQHASRKPVLCGLAFVCQESHRIESAEWDIKLEAILTEKSLLRIED